MTQRSRTDNWLSGPACRKPLYRVLTLTLQGRGLVQFDTQQRRYRLASGALTIGYPLLANLQLRREARPGMQQLADELGGSVSLGMRDRTRMIYVETSRGNDPISFHPDIGASPPDATNGNGAHMACCRTTDNAHSPIGRSSSSVAAGIHNSCGSL